MKRWQLTRRGELVVMLATGVALALVVWAAHNEWIRAYGLAAAAVLGLLFLAVIVATLPVAIAVHVRRGVTRIRQRRARARFTREAIAIAEERIRRRYAARAGRPVGGITLRAPGQLFAPPEPTRPGARVFGGGRW
jgi:hypothetical protein